MRLNVPPGLLTKSEYRKWCLSIFQIAILEETSSATSKDHNSISTEDAALPPPDEDECFDEKNGTELEFLNESRDMLASLSDKFDQRNAAHENEIRALQRRFHIPHFFLQLK